MFTENGRVFGREWQQSGHKDTWLGIINDITRGWRHPLLHVGVGDLTWRHWNAQQSCGVTGRCLCNLLTMCLCDDLAAAHGHAHALHTDTIWSLQWHTRAIKLPASSPPARFSHAALLRRAKINTGNWTPTVWSLSYTIFQLICSQQTQAKKKKTLIAPWATNWTKHKNKTTTSEWLSCVALSYSQVSPSQQSHCKSGKKTHCCIYPSQFRCHFHWNKTSLPKPVEQQGKFGKFSVEWFFFLTWLCLDGGSPNPSRYTVSVNSDSQA